MTMQEIEQNELELQELREICIKIIQEEAYAQGYRDGVKTAESQLEDRYNEGYDRGYKHCEKYS
jgi:hypothetical protein